MLIKNVGTQKIDAKNLMSRAHSPVFYILCDRKELLLNTFISHDAHHVQKGTGNINLLSTMRITLRIVFNVLQNNSSYYDKI